MTLVSWWIAQTGCFQLFDHCLFCYNLFNTLATVEGILNHATVPWWQFLKGSSCFRIVWRASESPLSMCLVVVNSWDSALISWGASWELTLGLRILCTSASLLAIEVVYHIDPVISPFSDCVVTNKVPSSSNSGVRWLDLVLLGKIGLFVDGRILWWATWIYLIITSCNSS